MWHLVKIPESSGSARWRWRRHELGSIVAEGSSSFGTMGQAILDAERHGFNALVHRWEFIEEQPGKDAR